MMGSSRPLALSPLAGTRPSFTEKISNSSVPIIKEGMETKAVVMTMMILSRMEFRVRAATQPRTMPVPKAMAAAMRPSLMEVFMPSAMTSMTWRPRSLMEGPKSNLVTISFR